MNLEEENKEKRKYLPLTVEEWLTYFFFPIDRNRGPKSFDEIEDERLIEFGFNKKIRQASEARAYGIIFYILLFVIIMIVINW